MNYNLTFEGSTISFNAKSQDNANIITHAINELLTKQGFVNLEVDDVKAITDGAEYLTAGEGTGEGDNRAEDSAREAVKNMNIADAKGILIAILTGPEIMLSEMSCAASVIEEASNPDASIIWGHVIDEALGDKVKTIVIAAY